MSVLGRCARPGTVVGVLGRYVLRASRDGRGPSWDGASVLGQSGERPETAASPSVLGRQVVSQGGAWGVLGRRGAASWDGVERPGTRIDRGVLFFYRNGFVPFHAVS